MISRDNLVVLDEPTNTSFTVDVGPSDATQRSRSQGRSKRTNTVGSTNSDNGLNRTEIRQIVSESFVSFREEMMSAMTSEISNMFRNLQLPAVTNNQIYNDSDIRNNSSSNDIRNSPSNSDSRPSQNPFYAEKVLNIIRNWRLKFTGHNNEMDIDEFIYRINILTTNNLGGDFELLCKHAHTLFDDRALEWFWRYHRQNNNIDWSTLTSALRVQYKSDYKDFDILEDIRRRRQKSTETFDEYVDIISSMADKLRNPMSDRDFCETILRNLKPEIRLELLHLDISNVSQLRREVRKHERFVKEFHSIESHRSVKGRVAELSVELSKDNSDKELIDVCAIQQVLTCWNCEKPGHTYVDCMEVRRVFCYGCGVKDTYKPTCPRCNRKNQGNCQKDVRRS